MAETATLNFRGTALELPVFEGSEKEAAVDISSLRGKTGHIEDGTPLVATVHPSWLLRIRDAETREKERMAFMADLRRAWQMVG